MWLLFFSFFFLLLLETLLNLLLCCFCFMFWFLWPPNVWDPSSPTRGWTLTPVGLSPLGLQTATFLHISFPWCVLRRGRRRNQRRGEGVLVPFFFIRTLNLLDRDLPTPMASFDLNYFLTSNKAALGFRTSMCKFGGRAHTFSPTHLQIS